MKAQIYRLLILLSKKIGSWFIEIFVWVICTGYFIFLPLRTLNSIWFYRAVFPRKNYLSLIGLSWKQYHSFSKIFIERLSSDSNDFTYTMDGLEYLMDPALNKTGGIILMSHFGNWETAAILLKQAGPELLLHVGAKNREEIEKMQKDSLKGSGIKLLAASKEGGSPLDIIESITFLRKGGLVSLTGDRLWGENQRSVTVTFFGHNVQVPETPYMLAMLSGAPIFVFFVFKTGRRKYRFKVKEPFYLNNVSKSKREWAVKNSAQQYISLLEEAVLEHPHEWYHFESFLGDKV